MRQDDNKERLKMDYLNKRFLHQTGKGKSWTELKRLLQEMKEVQKRLDVVDITTRK